MSTTVAIPGKGLTDEELDALFARTPKTPSRAEPVSTPGKGLTDEELDNLFAKQERPRPQHTMRARPPKSGLGKIKEFFPGRPADGRDVAGAGAQHDCGRQVSTSGHQMRHL